MLVNQLLNLRLVFLVFEIVEIPAFNRYAQCRENFASSLYLFICSSGVSFIKVKLAKLGGALSFLPLVSITPTIY